MGTCTQTADMPKAVQPWKNARDAGAAAGRYTLSLVYRGGGRVYRRVPGLPPPRASFLQARQPEAPFEASSGSAGVGASGRGSSMLIAGKVAWNQSAGFEELSMSLIASPAQIAMIGALGLENETVARGRCSGAMFETTLEFLLRDSCSAKTVVFTNREDAVSYVELLRAGIGRINQRLDSNTVIRGRPPRQASAATPVPESQRERTDAPQGWKCEYCGEVCQPDAESCTVCSGSRPPQPSAAAPVPESHRENTDAAPSWKCEYCGEESPSDAEECIICHGPRPEPE